MLVLGALILLIQAIVGIGLVYLYILLIAGNRPHRPAVNAESLPARFAVVIPAHNEESVIAATVACLLQMDYPREMFDVHIVADYCDDGTAQVAQAAGAIAHERCEGPRGRKGYALEWLLARLLGNPKHYDAIAVFDADSQPWPDFLSNMNQALAADAQVIQGKHVIANPNASTFSTLADADMRLNNRIRNQAKENLGLSARLMGDAMCFQRQVLQTYPWASADSLTEDRGYGLYLVTQGIRVHFAPKAISAGQATARWRDATGQRLRWYGGGFDLQKRYLRPLLASAWRDHNMAAFDLALELVLPPFSTLCALAACQVILSLFMGIYWASPSFCVSLVLALMTFAYPFWGLLVEQAPLRSFAALVYGPIYATWRVWLSLKVRLQPNRVAWIRTRRAEESRSTK